MALKNSTGSVSCSKRGVKHPRHVRDRCKMTLNISTPVIRETHNLDDEVHSSVVRGNGQAATVGQRSESQSSA